MKSLIEEIYNKITNTGVKTLHGKCPICAESLGLNHSEHLELEHNNLNKILWDFDYSNKIRTSNPYRLIFDFGSIGCKMCSDIGRNSISKHYINEHPDIIRFLHKWNVILR